MGTGYIRQDTSNNIADGKVIDANDLDSEFDAIQSAFNNSTGHTHDGTSAEGAPIEVTGPAQEYESTSSALQPKTDDTYDLGSATNKWKDLYVDGVGYLDSLEVTGNIVVSGTVDGRDIATDGTKLDGIETGATADQTGAEIKAAYEAELDTNAYTDAEKTKLAGIEASADVTDTANVTAAGALMDSEVSSLSGIKTLTVPDSTTISAFGATLVDDADAATARTTLGAQAQDDHLDDLAALSAVSAAGKIMMSSAPGTWAYEDLVGTVSQSGGTPTGAVIERGSNANGEYVKFADGTMICTRECAMDVTLTGNQFFSWAATFDTQAAGAVSHLTASPNAALEFSNIRGATANAGQCVIRLSSAGTSSDPTADDEKMYATGFGKWF